MRPVLLVGVISACVVTDPPSTTDDPSPAHTGEDVVPPESDTPETDPPHTDVAETDETDPVDTAQVDPGPVPPNVLLLILDDIGTDMIGAYGIGHDAPPTPSMDRLAAEGVLFERAYANPWCSPTRATIATGLYSRRVGIGRAIEPGTERTDLPLGTLALPELLLAQAPHRVSTAVIGKWHLASMSGQGADGPLLHGFDTFTGTLANLDDRHSFDGLPQHYWDWERIEGGQVARTTDYATTRTVDDVLSWVEGAQEPWFAWVGLHAAHFPWHVPPDDLHDFGQVAGIPLRTRAMTQALDTELGRLLDALDPDVLERTVVVLVGDNGTATRALTGPLARAPGGKGTPYELGTRVPLLVRGPVVARPGSRTDALVGSVDLFPTIAGILGVDVDALGLSLDGVSFLPHLVDPDQAPRRPWVYMEEFAPNRSPSPSVDERAVRDDRWRLVRLPDGDRLYDLAGRTHEGTDLLAAGTPTGDALAAWQRLSAVLDALDATF